MDDTITTKRITITDDQGRPRIVLGTDEAGNASLTMLDKHERHRVSITVEDDAGTAESRTAIKVRAGDTGPAALLETRTDGSAGLRLMRVDGHPLAVLDIEPGPDSRPYLALHDPTEQIPIDSQGKAQWEPEALVYLTATEDPEAYLQFVDPTGHPLARFP